MSNFPERPALLALALVLTLGSGAPAMADACVSESFLHRMESGIESSETISDQGDAQILGGTGQGLYEVRYLRPDYALTSFHAIGNGEDGGHDAGPDTGSDTGHDTGHDMGGRLYLGYVDYDPALLTGAPGGDFVFGGSFIALEQGEGVEILCIDDGRIDASVVTSTLEAVAAIEHAAGNAP